MNSTPQAPRARKLYNLILPLDVARSRVLLGYKKRGFGEGKYNGFGGKVEPNETILESALRELEEESNLKATKIQHRAILFLETVADLTAPILEIHVYVATEWENEPMETNEMRPEWYPALPPDPSSPPSPAPSSSNQGKIPFHQMWEETRLWLPKVLAWYFPLPTLTSSPDPNPDPNTPAGDQKTQFIHHVTYVGGFNPEIGKEDVWHGLDCSYIEYFPGPGAGEGGDLEEWTEADRGRWVEGRREAREIETGEVRI